MKKIFFGSCMLMMSFGALAGFEHHLKSRLSEEFLQQLEETKDATKSKEFVISNFNKDLENVSIEDRESIYEMGLKAIEEFKPPKIGDSTSPYKTKYASSEELLHALMSPGLNADWFRKTHIEFGSINSFKKDGSAFVSLKLGEEKFGFGAEAVATASIKFETEFAIDVNVVAEGLYAATKTQTALDGEQSVVFDFIDRDRDGHPILVNGYPKKRYIYFECNMSLTYKDAYQGEGEFKASAFKLGAGGSRGYSKEIGHSLNYVSRRLSIPETMGGVITTPQQIVEMCESEWPRQRVNGKTIEQNLREEMKASLSTAIFHHPKTTCVKDNDCQGWFQNKIAPWHQYQTEPKCLETVPGEKIFSCDIKAVKGGACSVYNSKGKRISSGDFEHLCSKPLLCQKVSESKWFPDALTLYKYAQGQCLPVKKKAKK